MQYTKKFNLMLCVSAAIVLVALIMGFVMGGLNVGVDFTGGTLFIVEFGRTDFDMNAVTNALNENGVKGAQAIRTGNTTSTQTQAEVRMQSTGDDETESTLRTSILESIRKTYPEAQITSVDRVDGVASRDLIRNALLSVAIASVLMLVYIWIRFELLSGLAAVCALLHDVIIMVAFTCIFQIPVNSPFIAAILTIVGYSINNTIVVFDRIRENSKNKVYADKNREEIVNKSIKSTLTRSINTSFTTIITITMVYILGTQSIREFALPIIIGLLAGTYSSIFLAGPMWGKWHIAQANKAKSSRPQTAK